MHACTVSLRGVERSGFRDSTRSCCISQLLQGACQLFLMHLHWHSLIKQTPGTLHLEIRFFVVVIKFSQSCKSRATPLQVKTSEYWYQTLHYSTAFGRHPYPDALWGLNALLKVQQWTHNPINSELPLPHQNEDKMRPQGLWNVSIISIKNNEKFKIWQALANFAAFCFPCSLIMTLDQVVTLLQHQQNAGF